MPQEQPYRTPAPPAAPAAPEKLVYVPRDGERGVVALRVFLQTALVTVVAVAVTSTMGLPWASLFVAGASVVIGVWRWRRFKNAGAIVMRVQDGELHARFVNGDRPPLHIPLRYLRNVKLDTKSIRKVVREAPLAPVPIQTSVGGVVDVSRIMLVPVEPGPPVTLTEAHLAHMECVEQLGAIRAFLRAHGWVPEDEREH
jgi:hypothetical protein